MEDSDLTKIGYWPASMPLNKQRGVSHCVALPSILKSILRKKKNYENSNISQCKSIIFGKKSYKRNQNPLSYSSIMTISLRLSKGHQMPFGPALPL